MAFWNRKRMIETGEPAPEFQLPDADGAQHSLGEILARGPAFFAFFKVSCPVCQYTFPFLERLHRGGTAGGIQVIGISQDQAAATRAFAREYGVTFPILLDSPDGYAVSNAFGISSVPSLFLVEPDGAVSISRSGFSKADLEAVGKRTGAVPFLQGERVPESRPG
jgi:peroxiredoxin